MNTCYIRGEAEREKGREREKERGCEGWLLQVRAEVAVEVRYAGVPRHHHDAERGGASALRWELQDLGLAERLLAPSDPQRNTLYTWISIRTYYVYVYAKGWARVRGASGDTGLSPQTGRAIPPPKDKIIKHIKKWQ